jgi:hypothetical protein
MKKSWSYEVKDNLVKWEINFKFDDGQADLTVNGSFKLEGITNGFTLDQIVSGFSHGLSQKFGDKAAGSKSEEERRKAVEAEVEAFRNRNTWNATERTSRETIEELEETLEKIKKEMASDIIKGNSIILEAMRKQQKATENKIKNLKKKKEEKEEKQEEKPETKTKKKK